MKNFIRKFLKIIKSKWIIYPPKKKKILMFDVTGYELIKPFLNDEEEVGIYYRRYEEINLYIFFLALINFNSKLDLTQRYQHNFIKYVEPKLVITFIDNLLNFYELKNYFNNIKFVSIQNGLRNQSFYRKNELGDLEKLKKKSLKIDYYFTFSNSYKDFYSKFIEGNYIVHGSIRNNAIKIERKAKKKKKNLLYISQFHPYHYKNFENKNYFTLNSQKFSYKNFKEAELIIIPEIMDYCKKNEILLKILSKTSSKAERTFYQNILKNDYNFCEFIIRDDKNYAGAQRAKSYQIIDESNAVVFIDSALGYESFSRATPTASFSIRGQTLTINQENKKKFNYFNFGFPEIMPEDGPFWVSSFNRKKINEILDYILNVNDFDWKNIKEKYVKRLMSYDYENAKLRDILNLCLTK